MGMAMTFGPYTLLEPLGKGGMAVTYKAKERLELGGERLVVVKQILPRWAADRRFQEMFLDEARVSCQLRHTNICSVYKGGWIDDTLFLAMEYVNGADLMELFKKARARLTTPFPLAHTLFIVEQTLNGLDAAHAATNTEGELLHLIHRDISPHNVLLSRRGEVKLIDFGVAKSKTNISRTDNNEVKGKIAYASPEQILRIELDGRSDLFAVGLLMYKLSTGVHPLVGPDQNQTYMRFHDYTKGHITIAPPSSYTPSLPRAFDEIVMKALRVDREARFSDGDEMAKAVGNLLRDLFPRYRATTFGGFVCWTLDPDSGPYLPPLATIPSSKALQLSNDDTIVWNDSSSRAMRSLRKSSKEPLLDPHDPIWDVDTSDPPTLMRGPMSWLSESSPNGFGTNPDSISQDISLEEEGETALLSFSNPNVLAGMSDLDAPISSHDTLDDTLLDFDLQKNLMSMAFTPPPSQTRQASLGDSSPQQQQQQQQQNIQRPPTAQARGRLTQHQMMILLLTVLTVLLGVLSTMLIFMLK